MENRTSFRNFPAQAKWFILKVLSFHWTIVGVGVKKSTNYPTCSCLPYFLFTFQGPRVSGKNNHILITVFSKKNAGSLGRPQPFSCIYIYNEMQYKQQHNGSFCLPFNFMCWDYCGPFPRFRGYQGIYADTPRSQDLSHVGTFAAASASASAACQTAVAAAEMAAATWAGPRCTEMPTVVWFDVYPLVN